MQCTLIHKLISFSLLYSKESGSEIRKRKKVFLKIICHDIFPFSIMYRSIRK